MGLGQSKHAAAKLTASEVHDALHRVKCNAIQHHSSPQVAYSETQRMAHSEALDVLFLHAALANSSHLVRESAVKGISDRLKQKGASGSSSLRIIERLAGKHNLLVDVLKDDFYSAVPDIQKGLQYAFEYKLNEPADSSGSLFGRLSECFA